MNRMKTLMTAVAAVAIMAASAPFAMADGAKIAIIGGKTDDPFFAKAF